MKPRTVTSAQEAIENIHHYQNAIRENREIQAREGRVWSWYAIKDSKSGAWQFAPSKFIVYRNPSAKLYLQGTADHGGFDGRITERSLAQWFMVLERGSKRERELIDALGEFHAV